MATTLPIFTQTFPDPGARAPESAPAAVTRAIRRALSGERLSLDEGRVLMRAPLGATEDLLGAASELRDRGHGKVITFSAKAFFPLTTLCRDYCGYCTFRRDPGEEGAHTMLPDEVLSVARSAERLGIKEALFSLGDRPEAIFPEHAELLRSWGHRTTLGYLRDRCADVLGQTALIPHSNPGLMGARELAMLRPVNASLGLMLESTSERLLEAGGPHERAPDKLPRRRLRTLEQAGAQRIPFTTGILIGIGETLDERIEALDAVRTLHETYRHIQEVIVQNFRVKSRIPMRDVDEPAFEDLQRTLATARLFLGPRMNLQAPPNLSPLTYPELIRAGLNDWGGISPLTIDHINPEAPWPLLVSLREATSGMGYEMRERLSVYPEYIVKDEGFVDGPVLEKLKGYVGGDGLVKPQEERWRQW